MSSFVFENPKWLRDAVRAQFPRRESIGASQVDYRSFIRQITVRAVHFGDEEPVEVPGSQVIIDVDKKVYKNGGDAVDEAEVQGLKSETQTSTKNYQLTVGQSQGKQFNIGGNAGLNASFFNVGGAGVGLNAGYTKSSGKSEEQQYGEERSVQLGKSYGVVAKVQIPPNTRLTVKIITYSLTYRAQSVQIEVSARSSTRLLVYLERVPCCCGLSKTGSIFAYIYASDFLKSLGETDRVESIADDRVRIITTSHLTYLGEKTLFSKSEEKL